MHSLQYAYRDSERAFLLEGPILVDDALEHGHPLEAVFAEPPMAAAYRDRGIDCSEVAPGTLAKVLDTVTPQAVVAIATMPAADLESVAESLTTAVGLEGCAVVLDGVADPGNGGAVLRSAEAAGFGAVLFRGGSGDPFVFKCVRASAGSILHLPVVSGPE